METLYSKESVNMVPCTNGCGKDVENEFAVNFCSDRCYREWAPTGGL